MSGIASENSIFNFAWFVACELACVAGGDEAVAFVKELDSELDRSQNNSALTACVGSRRDIHEVKRITPKGGYFSVAPTLPNHITASR
eukprot:3440461-Amphidinium_carterae.1